MKRRNFVAGAILATPMLIANTAQSSSADWDLLQQRLNKFTQEDTPEQRLEKFNQLTGLGLTFGPHWKSHANMGERCLMDGEKHFTGPMTERVFMDWTAQVALGYRLKMVQG